MVVRWLSWIQTFAIKPAILRLIQRSYTVGHKMARGVLEIYTENEENL